MRRVIAGRRPTIVIALVAVSASLSAGVASGAPTAPEPTFSLYVTTATQTQLCNWGKNIAAAQKASPPTVAADAFIIMHFFAPMEFSAGVYGASRGSGPDQTSTDIRLAAQKLGSCWFNNSTSGKTLKIAMGVTSDPLDDAVTAGHGRAWALMVADANRWAVNQRYSARLSFNGAFDAEPSFGGTVRAAKDWIDGYRNANTGWNVFFYGDAEGCPSDKNPSSTCSWPRDDIIYIAWRNGYTTAFPQIYDEEPSTADPPTSVNAQQWQTLSERAVALGYGRINFAGGLSQYRACVDTNHPPECDGAELRPKAAWRDLWDEVNCTYGPSPCTTNDDLRWTTQLTWKQTP